MAQASYMSPPKYKLDRSGQHKIKQVPSTTSEGRSLRCTLQS